MGLGNPLKAVRSLEFCTKKEWLYSGNDGYFLKLIWGYFSENPFLLLLGDISFAFLRKRVSPRMLR